MADWTKNPTPEQQQALDRIQGAYRNGHATRRDYLSLPWYADSDNALPIVPHPSMFQKDPLVIGGGVDRAQLARRARRLLDLDPGTKERTGTITYGPTTATMEQMSRGGLPMGTRGGTNLNGLFDLRTGSIGLQERSLDDTPLTSTLAHEIGHAAGQGHSGPNGGYKIGAMAAPLTDTAAEREELVRRLREQRGGR